MALSGSFTGTTGNQHTSAILVWTATQSVTGNTSTITAKLYYNKGTTSNQNTGGNWSGTINIGGTSKSFSGIHLTLKPGGGSVLAATYSRTITHDADGTKSVALSATGAISGTTLDSTTVSGTATLDTIPRKSTLSASNGTLGTAQTLTVTKQATSFTHTITYICGSASGTVCTKSSSTSVSFTPPLSLAAQNTTGTSVSVKLTITTYNGSTSLGSNTKTISCSIPSSVKPSCTLTLSDAKGYSGTYGGYVQGESQLAITVNPTTAQGAAISSYSVSFDGKSYATQTVTTAAISGSGTLAASATVKDTRGRTGTVSQNVTVLAYSRPSVTKLDVHRCNSDGTENAQGAYAKATYTFNITSLSSKNAKTIRLGYKKSSATSYTYVSITSAYTATNATKVFAAETGSSYDVVLEVTDSFGTTTRTTSVSTAAVVFHVRADGTGLAIGKVSERANAFEVGNDSYFSKGVNVTGAGSFGSASVTGASTFGGAATFNNTMADKFGTSIGNGLASYSSSSQIDPNTTAEHLILTNHVNGPMGLGVFYYIQTVFYGGKSSTAYRAQWGLPYNQNGSMFHRRYDSNGWSSWRRHVNADETITTLWTGSWSSGTIDVPDITEYHVYIIDLDDSNTRILAVRESTKIRGIGGMANSSNNSYIETIGFSLSGTTLTYDGQTTRYINASNVVSTYASGHAVLGIYGVI